MSLALTLSMARYRTLRALPLQLGRSFCGLQVNDLQLAVVHPPGNSDQHKPERVDPSLRFQNPLSQPRSRSTEPPHLHADPVFGPYGINGAAVEPLRCSLDCARHELNGVPVGILPVLR